MEYSQEWFYQNTWWIILLLLWDIAWKGWALWLAARNGSKPWFTVLLLLNTLGILPIFYVFLIDKRHLRADA